MFAFSRRNSFDGSNGNGPGLVDKKRTNQDKIRVKMENFKRRTEYVGELQRPRNQVEEHHSRYSV